MNLCYENAIFWTQKEDKFSWSPFVKKIRLSPWQKLRKHFYFRQVSKFDGKMGIAPLKYNQLIGQ